MYNFLSKNGQLLAFLVGVVLVVIFLGIAFSQAGNYDFANMKPEDRFFVNIFDFGLLSAIVLTIISAAGMLLFGLYQVVTNAKGSVKGLIGVAVIVLVMILLYNMAPGTADHPTLERAVENYQTSAEGRFITEGNMKWIGSSIRMGLLMSILAFAALMVMPLIAPILNRIK